MVDKQGSAQLLLKLYELRQEETMRKARDWFLGFQPECYEDLKGSVLGARFVYFRMVVTYWEMAASLVNHGAIDAEMFHDVTNEHLIVFAKIHPFFVDLRMGSYEPGLFKHLERLVMSLPNAGDRLVQLRKRALNMAAANEKTSNLNKTES